MASVFIKQITPEELEAHRLAVESGDYIAALDRGCSEYDPRLDPDVIIIPKTPGGPTYYIRHKGKILGPLCWRLRSPTLRPDQDPRCTRPAGHNTEHTGLGACSHHGGNSYLGSITAENILQRKGYTAFLQDQLQARYDAFTQMAQPRDLNHELALLRVLLSQLVEEELWDSKDVRDTLEAIGRMVDRMERIDMSMAVTQVQIQLLVVHMVALIKKHIAEPDQRLAFATEFLSMFGLKPESSDNLLTAGDVSDQRVIELAKVKYGMVDL